MHTIGLGALQQRHVAQASCRTLERLEQVPEHQVVGEDLFLFPPARHQPGPFMERGIDEMRDTRELGRKRCTCRCIREIELKPARAERFGRPSARDGDHFAAALGREVLHRGVTDKAGGAGDEDLL